VKRLPLTDRSSSGVALEGRGARLTTRRLSGTSWRSAKALRTLGPPLPASAGGLKEQPGLSVRIDSLVALKLSRVCGSTSATADLVGCTVRSACRSHTTSSEMGFGRNVSADWSKVTEVLCERLPSDVARRLPVRVYQHPEPRRPRSGSFSLGPSTPTSPSR